MTKNSSTHVLLVASGIASSREINFNYVLAFELAAYPPSMFNADGKMNVATCKSILKHKLQVTIS